MSQTNKIYYEKTTETNFEREAEIVLRKIHKTKKHIDFNRICIEGNLLPNYTYIDKKTVQKLRLKKPEIITRRRKHVNDELNDLKQKLLTLNNQYQTLFLNWTKSSNINCINKTISILKSKILNSEKVIDNNRNSKLLKLKSQNSNTVNDKNFATVQIINYTSITIPPEITKILQFGLDSAIGGSSRKDHILSKFEGMFQQWAKFAHNQGLDILKISEIRSLLFSEFLKFSNCSTPNSDREILRNFLNQHENIVFMPVDKSKNMCLF